MYDLVTFDIFDTLVHRRLRAPVDLFDAVRLSVFDNRLALVHHDLVAAFTRKRMVAESTARAKWVANNGGDSEISLDEIYDEFQFSTGCSDELRDLFRSTELKLEKEFLYASKGGMQAFRSLVAQSKNVAFVSDMYLPSQWLRALLVDLGYAEAADAQIFVSCEHRKSKHSGALYTVVKEAFNLASTSDWLHVGDNLHADIAQAKLHGIQTKWAEWATVDNVLRQPKSPESSYFIESLLEFQKTKQALDFIPADPYSAIGYTTFGPLIFGYVAWLVDQVNVHKLSNMVFIGRDGWLPHDLYELVKPDVGQAAIRQSYLHFSRRAGIQTGTKGFDDSLGWTVFGGKVARSLRTAYETAGQQAEDYSAHMDRFGFLPDDVTNPNDLFKPVKMYNTAFQKALGDSVSRRREFESYFAQHFRANEKTGIVDIGWNGNIQKFIIGSLGSEFNKSDFVGLFLGLHGNAHRNRELGYILNGWMSHFGQPHHVEHYLHNGGVELLEFALTADHGTTLGFTKNAEGVVVPVLEELEPGEADYRNKAMRLQDGIRKFFDDYRFLFKLYNPAVLKSTTWVQPFERLVTDPTMQEIELFGSLTHADTAGTTTMRLPLAQRESWKVRHSRRRRTAAREKAFWKSAFDKLNA